MMRFLFPICFIVLVSGCRFQSNVGQSKPDQSKFYADTIEVADTFLRQMDQWIKPDVKCFGILIVESKGNRKEILGTVLPCKIISTSKFGAKCEVLEDIRFFEDLGCEKIAMKKGDVWLEKTGELFRNKKEAIDYLKLKGL